MASERIQVVEQFGPVPIFECFRVENGQIVEAQAFLDPRPFLGGEP